MDDRTKKILETAKSAINDESVFTYDQITLLFRLIDIIGEPMESANAFHRNHHFMIR